MQIGLPEQAGRDRAPRCPTIADLAQLALAGPLGEAEAVGDRELQAEIGGRPDVAAAEREDQIDLGAPAADPLEADQLGQHRRDAGRLEPGEIEGAADYRRGQPAGIIHFMPAEAAAPQRRVVERQKRLGGQWPAQLGEPAVHRRGGIDRHLLFEDDVQQRREAVAAAAEARHAGAVEDGAEHRLPGEHLHPFFQVLRRVDQLHGISPTALAP